MTNKKVIFTIFAFAVVAALLTMAKNNHSEMMGGYATAGIAAPMVQKFDDSYFMDAGPTDAGPTDATVGKAFTTPSKPMMIAPEMNPMYGNDMALSIEDRIVEKNSYHGVLVENVPEYVKQLKAYLQNVGGKIISSTQNVSDDMQYASLTVKVPVDKFDEVTGMIASKAKKVMSESINASDVTAQQVNIDDRTQSLQQERVKKESALAAAKTDADKKQAQYELDMVLQQIKDSQRAQVAFSERVNYATVSITAADSEDFFNPQSKIGWHGEVKQAVGSLGMTGSVVAYFLIWVVVYAIIWLPLVLLGRWIWFRMRSNTKK